MWRITIFERRKGVIPSVYWLCLRDYDQRETVASLAQRILVLQGERDYQVTMQDFAEWRWLCSHIRMQRLSPTRP